MPAYIVVEVEVHDPERYETYKGMSPGSIAAYGGRFVVRGGATKTLEGEWSPSRFVILEFPSAEVAERWWSSPEYADAKALRQATASTQMVLAPGVAPTATAGGGAAGDHTGRPGEDEVAAFYASYVARVPAGGLAEVLAHQIDDTCRMIGAVGEEGAEHAYAPGKWTIKEMVGHLIDVERILGCRALRFARGDRTELPGFEEDPYVVSGQFGRRTLASLLEELRLVRRSTVMMLTGFPEEAWLEGGVANGSRVTVRGLAAIIAGHELHHRAVLAERYGVGG